MNEKVRNIRWVIYSVPKVLSTWDLYHSIELKKLNIFDFPTKNIRKFGEKIFEFEKNFFEKFVSLIPSCVEFKNTHFTFQKFFSKIFRKFFPNIDWRKKKFLPQYRLAQKISTQKLIYRSGVRSIIDWRRVLTSYYCAEGGRLYHATNCSQDWM